MSELKITQWVAFAISMLLSIATITLIILDVTSVIVAPPLLVLVLNGFGVFFFLFFIASLLVSSVHD